MTYSTKLHAQIMAKTPNKWYLIAGRPDYEQMVQTIKDFIDSSEPFELSADMRRFKRLTCEDGIYFGIKCYQIDESCLESLGVRIEKVEEGHTEEAIINGRSYTLVHEKSNIWKKGEDYKPSYQIFKGDKLIGIES